MHSYAGEVLPNMSKSLVHHWKSALFERTWTTHRQRVLNLIVRLVGDVDSADDLCQEVAIRALKGFHLFRSDASTYTWLYRIAVNVVLRHREKKGLVMDVLVDNASGGLPSREPGPEASALIGDRRRAVQKAVDKLPEDLRTVVVLSVYEQLRYQEISSILGIPVGTIKSRRHAANAILRKELSDYAV